MPLVIHYKKTECGNFKRETLVSRKNGSNNIGNHGELCSPKFAKISVRKQHGSEKNSVSLGQGPKDTAIAEIDSISENRPKQNKVVRDKPRHKVKKHKRLRGDGRLPKKTGKGILRVSAWRREA
jgi:hypothetical protein